MAQASRAGFLGCMGGVVRGGRARVVGTTTAIQWTDRTWNAWQGCTKVSPGCAHCYMFRDHERYGKADLAGVVRRSSPATFNAPLKWERDLTSQARGASITP